MNYVKIQITSTGKFKVIPEATLELLKKGKSASDVILIGFCNADGSELQQEKGTIPADNPNDVKLKSLTDKKADPDKKDKDPGGEKKTGGDKTPPPSTDPKAGPKDGPKAGPKNQSKPKEKGKGGSKKPSNSPKNSKK